MPCRTVPLRQAHYSRNGPRSEGTFSPSGRTTWAHALQGPPRCSMSLSRMASAVGVFYPWRRACGASTPPSTSWCPCRCRGRRAGASASAGRVVVHAEPEAAGREAHVDDHPHQCSRRIGSGRWLKPRRHCNSTARVAASAGCAWSEFGDGLGHRRPQVNARRVEHRRLDIGRTSRHLDDSALPAEPTPGRSDPGVPRGNCRKELLAAFGWHDSGPTQEDSHFPQLPRSARPGAWRPCAPSAARERRVHGAQAIWLGGLDRGDRARCSGRV